jgi:hypothetical protein
LPQTDDTSLTHCESQVLLQQNESAAQIWVAQVSQPDFSLPPVAHSE